MSFLNDMSNLLFAQGPMFNHWFAQGSILDVINRVVTLTKIKDWHVLQDLNDLKPKARS